MSYGITTVWCVECEATYRQYGWLPIARQIWLQNEGLICCKKQTVIIDQEADE